MNKSSDDWNKLKHLVDLSAENARLKADAQVILKHLNEASADCARLKAELTNCKAEADYLKAEVERLRKAGDAMADAAYAHCICQDCEELRDQWRDAKRGKQP